DRFDAAAIAGFPCPHVLDGDHRAQAAPAWNASKLPRLIRHIEMVRAGQWLDGLPGRAGLRDLKASQRSRQAGRGVLRDAGTLEDIAHHCTDRDAFVRLDLELQ